LIVTSELCVWYGGRCIALVLHLFLRIWLLCFTVPLAIPDGDHRSGAKGDSSISHSRVRVLPWSLLDYLGTMVGMPMVWHGHEHHTRVVVWMVGWLACLCVHLLWLRVVHVGLARGEGCHVLLWVETWLGGPIRPRIGVDRGVLIFQRVVVGVGDAWHAVIVKVSSIVIDMYGLWVSWTLAIPHDGKGDWDALAVQARHEGGG